MWVLYVDTSVLLCSIFTSPADEEGREGGWRKLLWLPACWASKRFGIERRKSKIYRHSSVVQRQPSHTHTHTYTHISDDTPTTNIWRVFHVRWKVAHFAVQTAWIYTSVTIGTGAVKQLNHYTLDKDTQWEREENMETNGNPNSLPWCYTFLVCASLVCYNYLCHHCQHDGSPLLFIHKLCADRDCRNHPSQWEPISVCYLPALCELREEGLPEGLVCGLPPT